MDSTLSVDPGKCIICQQRISNLEPISRAEGKEKVRNAAKIRNDIVNVRLGRLELIGGDFVYHMNNECYKVYTMKKTLEKISESLKENPVPIEIDEPDLPMHYESEGPTIKRTRYESINFFNIYIFADHNKCSHVVNDTVHVSECTMIRG